MTQQDLIKHYVDTFPLYGQKPAVEFSIVKQLASSFEELVRNTIKNSHYKT